MDDRTAAKIGSIIVVVVICSFVVMAGIAAWIWFIRWVTENC